MVDPMTIDARTGTDRLVLLYAAEHAAERTIATGGATFAADTLVRVTPSTGYAVGGIGGRARTIPYPASRYEIARAILAMRDTFKHAPFIGTWADDETSTVYVDAVVILPDLESAGILARALGELAVYSFMDDTSIPSADVYS